jgi:serine/threonine-protein kinase HipA
VEFEAENARLLDQQPNLALVLAGERRCVKAIIHTVISEMVGRLS